MADLEHVKKGWNEAGFIAVLVDHDATEVQTAGVVMQLIDLNYLYIEVQHSHVRRSVSVKSTPENVRNARHVRCTFTLDSRIN